MCYRMEGYGNNSILKFSFVLKFGKDLRCLDGRSRQGGGGNKDDMDNLNKINGIGCLVAVFTRIITCLVHHKVRVRARCNIVCAHAKLV